MMKLGGVEIYNNRITKNDNSNVKSGNASAENSALSYVEIIVGNVEEDKNDEG